MTITVRTARRRLTSLEELWYHKLQTFWSFIYRESYSTLRHSEMIRSTHTLSSHTHLILNHTHSMKSC